MPHPLTLTTSKRVLKEKFVRARCHSSRPNNSAKALKANLSVKSHSNIELYATLASFIPKIQNSGPTRNCLLTSTRANLSETRVFSDTIWLNHSFFLSASLLDGRLHAGNHLILTSHPGQLSLPSLRGR